MEQKPSKFSFFRRIKDKARLRVDKSLSKKAPSPRDLNCSTVPQVPPRKVPSTDSRHDEIQEGEALVGIGNDATQEDEVNAVEAIENLVRDIPTLNFAASTESISSIEESPLYPKGGQYSSVSVGNLPGLEQKDDGCIDVRLLRNWIRTCEQEHGYDCSGQRIFNEEASSSDIHTPLDIVLIDVVNESLVAATTLSRYFTLSYVWGGVTQLRLKKSLKGALSARFGLREFKSKIPQVIQDAMQLVQSLGEQYLWVDALSIVDDDAQDKHHQIAHMADIYQYALATIVAVASRDARNCLPGLNPSTRNSLFRRCGFDELVPPLRPDLIIRAMQRSVYSSRGWTFQERLLSPRALFFFNDQVYFQCQRGLWSEEASLFAGIKQLNPQLDPGLNILAGLVEWRQRIEEGNWNEAFRFYTEIIEEYSEKQLSYQSDILKALEGLLTVLQERSGWSFIMGLPAELLGAALLWTPSHSVPQRRPNFPSWSWCGWTGSVKFRLAPHYGNLINESHEEFTDERIFPAIFHVSENCKYFTKVRPSGARSLRVARHNYVKGLFSSDHKWVDRSDGLSWIGLVDRRVHLGHIQEMLDEGYTRNSPLIDSWSRWLKFHTFAVRWTDGFGFSSQFFGALPGFREVIERPSDGELASDENAATPSERGMFIHRKTAPWQFSAVQETPPLFKEICGFLYGLEPENLPCREDLDRCHLLLISDGPAHTRISFRWEHIDDNGIPVKEDIRPGWWNCFGVILAIKTGDHYERLAVGQIDSAAWVMSEPILMEVILG